MLCKPESEDSFGIGDNLKPEQSEKRSNPSEDGAPLPPDGMGRPIPRGHAIPSVSENGIVLVMCERRPFENPEQDPVFVEPFFLSPRHIPKWDTVNVRGKVSRV